MPQPLQYSQPLFLEERPVSTWLGRAGTIIAVILIVLLTAAVVGITLLWRRAPGWSHGLMLFEVCLFAVLFVFLRQSRAVTILEASQLQLRLSIVGFTFWMRTICLNDMRSVEPVTNFEFRSVLQIAGGELRFMTGKANVRVKLDRANIVIGSAQPDDLLECLKKAITQSASPQAQ